MTDAVDKKTDGRVNGTLSAFPFMGTHPVPGRTKREWFAGMALQGLVAHNGSSLAGWDGPDVANSLAWDAVNMAESLLQALEVKS